MSARKETIEQTTKRFAEQYSRVLTGLAHYDDGKKIPGCDCRYCMRDDEAANEQR